MKKTVLIMAGGRGERFWPKSRRNLPKQFLSLTGDGKTMIQLTVDRLLSLVDYEDIFISTNKDYREIVEKQLPNIPRENILCEPVGRNTAPCIGLGAIAISKKYEDAIMYVLPSDHQIKFTNMFIDTLNSAASIAQEGENLVTIGITPTYPETGYGYIKFNPDKVCGRGYSVDRFVEKPSLDVAKEYVETEMYMWNSGMFTWKVSTILNKISEFLPDIFKGLMIIKEAIGKEDEEIVIDEEFRKMPSQSVDYGIMEKNKETYVVPGTFGWDDVGSWLAIERLQRTNEFGNVVAGDVISINTKNCIIQGDKKLIATVGLEDMIIVDTEDSILICNKNSAVDIKKVIENLKICNRDELI